MMEIFGLVHLSEFNPCQKAFNKDAQNIHITSYFILRQLPQVIYQYLQLNFAAFLTLNKILQNWGKFIIRFIQLRKCVEKYIYLCPFSQEEQTDQSDRRNIHELDHGRAGIDELIAKE